MFWNENLMTQSSLFASIFKTPSHTRLHSQQYKHSITPQRTLGIPSSTGNGLSSLSTCSSPKVQPPQHVHVDRFRDYLQFYLQDYKGIQTSLIQVAVSWLDFEETVSFDTFAMANVIFSIFDEYMRHVIVLYKFKAQKGLVPLSTLRQIFFEVAHLDEDVIGDEKDGVRSHLLQTLFNNSNPSEQKMLRFLTKKEFEAAMEAGLAALTND
ncbi:hypothetical protein BJ741DRAFT_709916 [Chytriomyces cf. hyalinus JEL632]|nr:hypothetical protein BJ741DRAFT_709916 [Chytriomyces cf. hyalinus JEL632]